MAINETIVTGRKFRKLIDEATKQWQRISFWTKASDVEFDDGNTLQNKLGGINGITSSLTSSSQDIALSASAGKTLQDQLNGLNGYSLAVLSQAEYDGISHNQNTIYFITED